MRDDQAPRAPGASPATQAEIFAEFRRQHLGEVEAEENRRVQTEPRRGGNSKFFLFLLIDFVFAITGHAFGWVLLGRDVLDGRGRRR